jgi:ABC-type multidrug transport system permease subunit
MEMTAILWREWMFFKSRFFKITSSQLISPLLYLVTFGLGFGKVIDLGEYSYFHYLAPGIAAMTSMRAAYSGVSIRVSMARLQEKSFENYIISPIKTRNIALGYILSGSLKGIYAAALLMAISFVAGSRILNPCVFFMSMAMNTLVFSALGFFIAVSIDTHYDLNRFSTYVITPMSFLCGTFFDVDGLPVIMRNIIEIMPLTHSVRLMRAAAFGRNTYWFSVIVLLVYIIVFTIISIRICYEEGRV